MYDRISKVSEQLSVGRAGKYWYVLDMTGDEPQAIRGYHPSKMVAIAVTLRVVEQGDYR